MSVASAGRITGRAGRVWHHVEMLETTEIAAAAPPELIAAPALVIVNLGTPEAPTAPAVRRYLAEFLHDHRVVQLSRWLWCPLLHFLILPLRGPKAAKKYAKIWLPQGSPLAVYTQRLAATMQSRAPNQAVSSPGVASQSTPIQSTPMQSVVHAMRYGQPSLKTVFDSLRGAGVQRVVVLPLYPQYSTTTTASIEDVLAREAGELQLVTIDDYSTDPQWVAAVADSIRSWRQQHGRGEHLLFSFHGLPQRIANAGDPYPQRCQASARAIALALGLAPGDWTLTYQSRFGKERWLEPSTEPTLHAMAARGVRQVDVVCPGFAVDCLETLEEVALQFAESFAERGGELRYIPCLNDSDAHADALLALARRAADAGA